MQTIGLLKNAVWIKTTSLVLIIAVLIPFLIHLAPPYLGVPVGAYLLPLFYIPFIALLWYGWRVALPVALLAPLLNFLLTGNPDWGWISILTLELTLFVCISYLLMTQKEVKWMAAPLAYLGSVYLSSMLLFFYPIVGGNPVAFFLDTVMNGIPGICILLLLNVLLINIHPKKKFFQLN
ncbi:hypothetical protein [Pararhodonellum marinum]|uniref:hypothetical protein n=1 Tax=Pararhodonellum marinum TaxID=2755358 RepID=UPI00188ED413|nr:hypothetical protein [Pararhodonellum marinum]